MATPKTWKNKYKTHSHTHQPNVVHESHSLHMRCPIKRRWGSIVKAQWWGSLDIMNQNSVFSISRNFCSINRYGKKIIPESLDIANQFLFNRSKGTLDQSKLIKLNLLQNFLVTVLKVWRGFKPCKQFYETSWLFIRVFWWNIIIWV